MRKERAAVWWVEKQTRQVEGMGTGQDGGGESESARSSSECTSAETGSLLYRPGLLDPSRRKRKGVLTALANTGTALSGTPFVPSKQPLAVLNSASAMPTIVATHSRRPSALGPCRKRDSSVRPWRAAVAFESVLARGRGRERERRRTDDRGNDIDTLGCVMGY